MQIVYKMVQFLTVMTCMCAKLVSAAHANLFIPSKLNHIQYNFVLFLFMFGENRQLVTNEPIEFEKELVEVQDCGKITGHIES